MGVQESAKGNENHSGIQSDPNAGDVNLIPDADKKDGESRTFTGKQIKGLRDQWSAYTRLMVEANILDSQIFNQGSAIGSGLIGAMGEIGVLKDSPPTLAQVVERTCWDDRLRTSMGIFQDMFRSMALWDSGKSADIEGLINDYSDILRSLAKDSKSIQASGKTLTDISAAAQDVMQNHGVQIQFNSTISAATNPSSPNRHPIQGVLFRVDEASEASPSVGPGLPLYIPKEVAEVALRDVSGLPFDAHDNLSEHANTEVTGVIQSGHVVGNDAVVQGCLWPWNRKDKVATILAQKEKLGMSMNAAAAGHEEVIDGRKVYWIDRLVLLGANILYSERATYQKTRLISARGDSDSNESYRPETVQTSDRTEETPETGQDGLPLATPMILSLSMDDELDDEGSVSDLFTEDLDELDLPDEPDKREPGSSEIRGDPFSLSANVLEPPLESQSDFYYPNGDHPTMTIDAEKLKEQLDQISASVGQLTGLTNSVDRHDEAIAQILTYISETKAEKKARTEEVQAAAHQKTREDEQTFLIQQIQAGVAEAVAKLVNPSGQPARRTMPISANAAVSANAAPVSEIQLQLASKQGELRAMESNLHANPSDMLQVQEQIHTLQMQLQTG